MKKGKRVHPVSARTVTARATATTATVAIMLAFTGHASAVAQTADEAPAARPSPIVAIGDCQKIPAAPARLACFDAAAAALEAAVTSKQLTVLDREGVRRTKRSLFGFTLPRIGLFGRPDERNEATEVTEINAKLQQVSALGNGKFRLTLDDGSKWQTNDSLNFPPSPGEAIHIKKAALGSYYLKIENSRGVKGMRIG